jgi:Family of unknown function (DUF6117)
VILQGHSQNFQMLLKAARNGDLCLLECFDPTTRAPRYAICAVSQHPETPKEEFRFVPFGEPAHGHGASVLLDDPYAALLPPEEMSGG